MDELPPITVPSLRVTDVAATDLTQHLALPVTYAPDQDGNAYAELASKDRPLSNDRSTVQQVVQLLNSTDIRYLYASLSCALYITPCYASRLRGVALVLCGKCAGVFTHANVWLAVKCGLLRTSRG
jgi:hypothetical protein